MVQNDTIILEIGNVVFAIRGLRSPEVQSEFKRGYQEFISQRTPEVICTVYWDIFPDIALNESDKILELQAGYLYYRPQGRSTLLFIRMPGTKNTPYLIADFSPDYKRNKVYISEENFYRSIKGNPFPFLEVMLLNVLSLKRGIIMHSCGLADEEKGYLFIGKSGNGKSTMARLWGCVEATILSDERVMVSRAGRSFVISGVPMPRPFDYGYGITKQYPLKKFFFIEHAPQTTISTISQPSVIKQLLVHSSLPLWDKKALNGAVTLLHTLASRVACYKLGFLPDTSVVEYVRSCEAQEKQRN